tara:strand:+ start:161 stop:496 length:336 start_codon:yes stop_codon:yes gene_type:complete
MLPLCLTIVLFSLFLFLFSFPIFFSYFHSLIISRFKVAHLDEKPVAHLKKNFKNNLSKREKKELRLKQENELQSELEGVETTNEMLLLENNSLEAELAAALESNIEENKIF